MFSTPILLLTVAVLVLVFSVFLLFRENERLEREMQYQYRDPASSRHLETYRQIVEHAQWGIATRSPDGQRIETCNPAFARIHGYDVGEIIDMPVADLFSSDNLNENRSYLRQIHSADHYRFESVHRRKDGSDFPALVDSSVIRDNAGNILFRVLNVLDISEQKAQSARLARSEATLRLTLEKLPVGVWLNDARGEQLYSNPAAASIMGNGKLPGLAGASQEAWWSDSGEPVRPGEWPLARAIRSRNPILEQIIDVRRSDGEIRTVVNSALPLFTDQNQLDGTIVMIQDITSIRKKDEALANSNKKLRELASYQDRVREDERTRIAREVHDELGQHMTALRMDLGLMRIKHAAESPALADDINRMKDAIDESIVVVRNIASDLRPKSLDMGFVPAARWLLSTMQKRSETVYTLDVDEENINLNDVSATTAFRILQESLTNIMRHARASDANIVLRKNANTFVMQIRDNGQGFDTDVAGKKETFGLIGLKERAIMLGGDCVIESEPGKGTAILVRFPLADAESMKVNSM